MPSRSQPAIWRWILAIKQFATNSCCARRDRHLSAISAVIARGAFNGLAFALGVAEAGQMTKPSVDPPRLAGPAARLSRLRIAGFKSFADPVELAVLPGLTGIVGPNGCGKSNVADALRWAMGKGRARTLRGAEMDDVIFAGTATRPGHNRAEVALTQAWCRDLAVVLKRWVT